MSLGIKRVVVAAATQTGAGSSTAQSAVALPNGELSLFLDVTAASASTQLTVYPEWTDDGGTTWYKGEPAEVFNVVYSTAVSTCRTFPVRSDKYRVSWDVTGPSPSYTFSVNSFGALI